MRITQFFNSWADRPISQSEGGSCLDRWVITVNPLPLWGLERWNPVYPESGPIRSDPAHFLSCYAILWVITVNPLPLWGLKRLDLIYLSQDQSDLILLIFLSCFTIFNFLNARQTSLLVENRGESYLDRWVMTVNPLPPWGLEGLNPVYPESGPIRSDPAHFFLSCYAILNFLTTRQTSLIVKNRGGSCLDRQVMAVNPLTLWGLERLDPIYPESGPIKLDPAHFSELLCNTQFFKLLDRQVY